MVESKSNQVSDSFEKNIFINCPFDPDYRNLLLCILFTTKYLGYFPRISLSVDDAGATRLHTIVELIQESRFGIHDLSRITAREKGEVVRMNMPFELGIDYGCKQFRGGKWSGKKLLVLEKERYRYQAALSDFSGSDIKNHEDDPIKVVRIVRDWLIADEGRPGLSHRTIWYGYNDFQVYLNEKLTVAGHEDEDLEDVPVTEIMLYMDEWLEESQL